MAVPLRVDTAPVWQLWVAAGLAALLLFVGIIVGAAGPAPDDTRAIGMYNCPGGSHVWDAATCNGTQLGDGNSTWRYSFGPLTTRNRFWAVSMTPYRRRADPPPATDELVTLRVALDVSVYHAGDPHGRWEPYTDEEHHVVDFRCHTKKYEGMCQPIGVAYEQTVDNPFHEVRVTPSAVAELGDVVFTVHWGNTAWTGLALAFNIVFMLLALSAFLFLLFALRKFGLNDWHFEQGSVLLLSFALLLYNNPFLALSYLVPGWFFLFLGSLCKTTFVALLLSFWLLLVEKIHKPEQWKLFSKRHLPKLAVVVCFFVCSVTAFTWSNIRDYMDPVFGQEDMIGGVVAFQAIAGICVTMIAIWILVILAMSVNNLLQSRTHVVRHIYFGIPSLLVGVAVLFGSFFMSFGANSNQVMEIMFFGALYNAYIWMLSFAVWPSACAHRVSNPRVEADEESASAATAAEDGEQQKLIS